MKISIKIIASILLTMVFVQSGDAQIFKKLKDRVEKAAEKAVLDKTEQKTREGVNKSMESAIEGVGRSDKKPAEVYKFDYIYKVQIRSDQLDKVQDGPFELTYYLSPTGDFIGTKMKQKGVDIFNIIETNDNTSHLFMKTDAGKMVTSVNFNPSTTSGAYDKDDFLDGATVTNLPDKTFMGYKSKGVKIENEDWKYIYYYVENLPISMDKIFGANKNQKALQGLPHENGLMMYASVTDKEKNGKRDMEMEVTEFKKTNYRFSTRGYKSW